MNTDKHMEHMNTLSGLIAEFLGALSTLRCHSIRPFTRMKQLKICGWIFNKFDIGNYYDKLSSYLYISNISTDDLG